MNIQQNHLSPLSSDSKVGSKKVSRESFIRISLHLPLALCAKTPELQLDTKDSLVVHLIVASAIEFRCTDCQIVL